MTIINNLTWYNDMSIIQYQNDISRYIRINEMLNKETIKKD